MIYLSFLRMRQHHHALLRLLFCLIILSIHVFCMGVSTSIGAENEVMIEIGEPVQESGWHPMDIPQWPRPFSQTPTQPYDHGNPTNLEQLVLELINSSRADPEGAAAHYGIDLNQGLAPGTISSSSKPPLAFNLHLLAAARGHSQWMLDTQTFSHTGQNGSSPGDRMSAAGYVFTGSWSWAENIGWSGTTGSLNAEAHTRSVVAGLFRSPGHRKNTLGERLEESGVGVLTGIMNGYNAVMITEKFAFSSATPTPMLLGVAYNDHNENGVYDPGEGVEGVTILPDRGQYYAVTSASGGFAIPVQGLSGKLVLNVSGGGLAHNIIHEVELSGINIKVDFELSQSPSFGSLLIHIDPPGAGDAGAQWRRVGTNLWLNSGATEIDVPTGTHIVEFKDVHGWTKPENLTVSVFEGQTATDTGRYEVNTYTVIFKDYDGAELKSEQVSHGSAATPPDDPTRTGYTFTGWDTDLSNVTGNLTVTAQYRISTYTVTPSAGEGGSIDPDEARTVNHGEIITFTVIPNPDFHIGLVSGCNGILSENIYTTGQIISDCTVDVIFHREYLINVFASPNTGGTVNGGRTYIHGQQVTVQAMANDGYVFTKWTDTGIVVSTSEKYIFTADRNRDLTAQFRKAVSLPGVLILLLDED